MSQHCDVSSFKTDDKLFSNVYLPERTGGGAGAGSGGGGGAGGGSGEAHKKRNTFFVDSRDIPKTNNFSYAITIDDAFKNVQSIELKGISFPKIEYESYVILEIDECKDRVESVDNSAAHHSFAVCYFDKLATGEIRPMRGDFFDRKNYIFNPSLNKLGKLNIRFKKQNGNIVKASDVGGDDNTGHTLLFEIVTKI